MCLTIFLKKSFDIAAKVENKRRLDKTGEHTKLEVKKIKHQKVRINSDVKEKSVEVKSASDMPGGNIFKSSDENYM